MSGHLGQKTEPAKALIRHRPELLRQIAVYAYIGDLSTGLQFFSGLSAVRLRPTRGI
jgi:hypothetical protein